MATFYTILTEVGQNKLANAIALGQTIEITELAVGDGNGTLPTPETSRTALVNEVRRASINVSEVDDENPNWIVVEQVLPPDVGGWTIREIGVFDVDGDLIGYGNYPETYKPVLDEGSSRTQTIRFVMEVSDTEAVTLKVDASVVLATRGYADNLIDEHEASRNHPLATTSERGMVEKATTQESEQGAQDKYPDAAGVQAALRANPYNAKAIAEPFPIWDHLTGVTPPSNSGTAKFIKLTAGLDGAGSYNEGLLNNETVSGSGPLIEITAEIATGPMAGQVVHLLNSENRYLMPGENSGTTGNDQMQQITGEIDSVTTRNAGPNTVLGAFDFNYLQNADMASGSGVRSYMNLIFDSADSADARTGDHTNVKHAQATYYMRIA